MIIFQALKQFIRHYSASYFSPTTRPQLDHLEKLVLNALAEGELHSLQIQATIQNLQHTLIPWSGSLYSALHRLERKGLITSRMSAAGLEHRSGNRRKYYQVTDDGIQVSSINFAKCPLISSLKSVTYNAIPKFIYPDPYFPGGG